MQTGYRPEIDGLRAVAVVSVVLFHAFPTLLPGGFIGVDVFFVISGYLITGIIAQPVNGGTFSFRDFYSRRARRLFPALTVVLLTVLVVGAFILMPLQYRSLGYHALAGSLFVPNLVFWNEVGYFDVAAEFKPLLHLWSLGVEEQFYLVWPILLYAAYRLGRPVLLISVIVACSFLYSVYAVWSGDVGAAFYSPLSRLWELGVGGLLALIPHRRVKYADVVGIFLIAACAFLYTQGTSFPGIAALGPVLGAALVIMSRSSALAAKPLVWVGLISYPLYLWHWPLISFAAIRSADSELNRLALVALSVLLAWITFKFIELPIRKGSVRVAPRWLAAGLACTATAGLAVYLNAERVIRYPLEVERVLEMAGFDYRKGTRFTACWLTEEPTFDPACKSDRIFIWGDSHAAMLATGLPVSGVMARSSCPPLLGFAPSPCASGNNDVLAAISETKPATVIIFAAWPNYSSDWSRWPFPGTLEDTISAVRNAGAGQVVVLGPAPQWSRALPYEIFENWRSTGRIAQRLEPAPLPYATIEKYLSEAAENAGAQFVSLYDELCNDRGCMTMTDSGDPIIYDPAHLSPPGATYIFSNVLANMQ